MPGAAITVLEFNTKRFPSSSSSSMTTREQRREEYSSSVRVMSPSRSITPTTHGHQFDNRLDNLLEDLQQSVSRPGSSLGQPINNYSSTREVQYLQPANVTTVARERSVSPSTITNERKIYKTAKYEYKSSGGSAATLPAGGRPDQSVSEVYQRNINQLDTLLNDLERERDSSLDRGNRSLSRDGIDSGLHEPGARIIKTTTTYSTTGGKQQHQPVNRELVFDSPNSYEVRQSRSRHRSPSYENHATTTSTVKNVSYGSDTGSAGIYGGIRAATPQRSMTPARSDEYYTETRTVSPSSDLVARNVRYNETVHVDDAANVLHSIPLSDDILPRPNTKVTTTVRTYTYELPPDSGAAGSLNQTIAYTNQAVNQTTSTLPAGYPDHPAQHVNPGSKTVLVKNETFNTTNNVQEYPVPTILNHPLPPNTAKTVYYKKDTKHSTTNYYPDQPVESPYPGNFRAIEPPPRTAAGSPDQPGGPMKYTVQEPGYPPGNNTTYIYREERTNTNNRYGSPVPVADNLYPTGPGGPGGPGGVPPPTTVTYKYSSTTTNATRNLYPPPAEREPLLQPFPTDGIDRNDLDGNPPRRLDDLMATFGEDGQIIYQSKVTSQTDSGPGPKRPSPERNGTGPKPIDDTVDQKSAPNQSSSSKNIAGPPVYYPPGHEMFAKKEMEASGWRSQGEYAKASGMYKYEAESKSKSSSKSGAAVVPVCLPLCCAMPCSIM
ncbi:AGAP006184-PA [Anopheles gambiae str. PEST]|uniref:AGAP006184-PA n=2 Tax=Anopheles gambiae TaxID=7165 RepID=Q7PNV8_ANOGA|nr:AGAP006184-PA [Anopheles gambiae str. PEST]